MLNLLNDQVIEMNMFFNREIDSIESFAMKTLASHTPQQFFQASVFVIITALAWNAYRTYSR